VTKSDIDFDKSCSLTRHLKNLSILDWGVNGDLARVLLSRFGYPRFTEPPETYYIKRFVQEIARTGPIDFLSPAKKQCLHCPYLDGCDVGEIFKNQLETD